MNILVINSGSSSIKYQLIEMPSQDVICSGMAERIGLDNAKLHFKSEINKIEKVDSISNHTVGLEKIAGMLMDGTQSGSWRK